MCFEARGNWILEEALKQQDPNLYVQSILARKADSREYSGYVRDRTVYFWECPVVTTFALEIREW